jgi:hypothetical protein
MGDDAVVTPAVVVTGLIPISSGGHATGLQGVSYAYQAGIMHLSGIPFGITDWQQIRSSERPGETGVAHSRVQEFGGVRVRLVEYSAGYRADHWCTKGHILFCVAGDLETELADGRRFRLTPGMSYQVADNAEPHRSRTASGATLFIVD